MNKKLPFLLVFFFAFACVTAFGQAIDVIIRDFNTPYPGFEEYDTDKNEQGVCAGSNPRKLNTQATADNAICFTDETNNGRYVPCSQLPGVYGSARLVSDSWRWHDNHLLYGQYGRDDNNNRKRGYTNGPDRYSKNNTVPENNPYWGNAVYVTRNMVQERLGYDPANCEQFGLVKGKKDDPDHIRYRYCAYLQKGNGACYGDDIQNWFKDGEHVRRWNEPMNLTTRDKYYEIQYDYNTDNDWGYGRDRGYFPLDLIEKDGKRDVLHNQLPFGRQGLNVWCPANADAYPDNPNCERWRSSGNGVRGPRDASAAEQAVAKGVPGNLRHNYGFSMAGSGEFTYKSEEDNIFEFQGDDDMWIFIDGELVDGGDLGGVHLAAPAKIIINDLAAQRRARGHNWDEGTRHSINFFYMDRGTNDSNLKLRMVLSELSDSDFGPPMIKSAKTIQTSTGDATTYIYTNNKLDEGQLQKIISSGNYPIVVHKSGDNQLCGYRIDSFKAGENVAGLGYAYELIGEVICQDKDGGKRSLVTGDSLAFNVLKGDIEETKYKDNGYSLTDPSFYVKSSNGNQATKLNSWGRNSTTLPPIEPGTIPTDPDPLKPEFVQDKMFNGKGPDGTADGGGKYPGSVAGGPLTSPPTLNAPSKVDGKGILPNITMVWDPKAKGGKGDMVPNSAQNGDNSVHSFGTTGKQIPPQRAGELILTAYPSATDPAAYKAWQEALEKGENKTFGLPPRASDDPNQWWGVVDPTAPIDNKNGGGLNNGYAFVKNGFPGESNTKGVVKLAPTRCTSDLTDPDKPRINCLNFSMDATGPFQISVIIYDQLGNFVTQYRETVTEQDFRNVTQAPNYANNTEKPTNMSEPCKESNNNNYGDPDVSTTNGMVRVNVNIYPFSSTGRRFGNGVYIAKIDRVDLDFRGCINSAGTASLGEFEYKRYHSEQKFGWARGKSK